MMKLGSTQIWKKLAAGLMLGTLLGTSFAAWADVVHFHNGKVMRGKLSRATGDLIEFVPEGIGATEHIQRITLTNRRDVVETRQGKKYFGEIIYVDKFKVDMMTSAGRFKINRLFVRNVVMGSPHQQPLNDFLESTGQQTARYSLSGDGEAHHTGHGGGAHSHSPGVQPGLMTPGPSGHQRLHPAPGEDQDFFPPPDTWSY